MPYPMLTLSFKKRCWPCQVSRNQATSAKHFKMDTAPVPTSASPLSVDAASFVFAGSSGGHPRRRNEPCTITKTISQRTIWNKRLSLPKTFVKNLVEMSDEDLCYGVKVHVVFDDGSDDVMKLRFNTAGKNAKETPRYTLEYLKGKSDSGMFDAESHYCVEVRDTIQITHDPTSDHPLSLNITKINKPPGNGIVPSAQRDSATSAHRPRSDDDGSSSEDHTDEVITPGPNRRLLGANRDHLSNSHRRGGSDDRFEERREDAPALSPGAPMPTSRAAPA